MDSLLIIDGVAKHGGDPDGQRPGVEGASIRGIHVVGGAPHLAPSAAGVHLHISDGNPAVPPVLRTQQPSIESNVDHRALQNRLFSTRQLGVIYYKVASSANAHSSVQGGLPGVADGELEPVGVAGVSVHHVDKGAVVRIAGCREPLDLPASVAILINVQASKSALRAPAPNHTPLLDISFSGSLS